MSRVVWKYGLHPGVTAIPVPGGSRIVHVGPSGYQVVSYVEQPAVWIEREHDPEAAADTVLRLVVVGTGHEVPADAAHVGSAWCGPFMWHVYELGPA